MARLNRAADLSPSPSPATEYDSDAASGSDIAASPPLRTISLAASLQSHGSDNMTTSPAPRSPLSPADCRTLEKLLRDVSNNSAPSTPSPLGPAEPLYRNSSYQIDIPRIAAREVTSSRIVGGEATDTGYEDDNDSMELTDGMEDLTVHLASLADVDSPFVSKSDRRPQDSMSMHDEEDKPRRYIRRCSSTTMPTKVKRGGQQDEKAAGQDDTTESTENLSELPARSSRSSQSNPRRPVSKVHSKEMSRLVLQRKTRKRLSRQARVRFAGDHGSAIALSSAETVQDDAVDFEESDSEGFDADGEDTTDFLARAQHRQTSQNITLEADSPTMLDLPSPSGESNVQLLVPNTPEAITLNPEPANVGSFAHQDVPETPFTKTLNYYKRISGKENTPARHRRNTALPQEIAEVAKAACNMDEQTDTIDQMAARSSPPLTRENEVPSTSALEDLMEMAEPETDPSVNFSPHTSLSENIPYLIDARLDTNPEGISSVQAEPGTPLSEDDAQKQLILYPQHPAIINAIGMIPATLFWATAAPIVKYGSMALELMIDQLRDTYL